MREAAGQGARLVVLPEVFIWRGNKKLEREFAEAIPGPTANKLGELARELKIFLLGGSILEEIPASPKAYNTSLLFDPAGSLLAAYRKIHLFDVDLANGVSLRESETRAHGGDVVAVQTELGTMGLSVCYDLRFPELYRGLAEQGRAFDLRPVGLHGLHRPSALGNSCCAPAPSRTKPISSPPISSARAPKASNATATR